MNRNVTVPDGHSIAPSDSTTSGVSQIRDPSEAANAAVTDPERRCNTTEGRELQRELSGMRSARRGVYRIVYEIDDAEHLVIVYRIEHRATAYRPR